MFPMTFFLKNTNQPQKKNRAPGYKTYAALRLLTGVFGIGWVLASFALVGEFLGKRVRGPALMLVQAVFAIGEITLAFVAYQVQPWRAQTMVKGVFRAALPPPPSLSLSVYMNTMYSFFFCISMQWMD